jgi:DNA-binding NarL/FixJ family response regulator
MSEDIKVSIVEDTESIRHLLQAIIEGAPGYVIAGIYENAEDALDDIPLKKPDVVLMDINLPGMNGIECVKLLKGNNVASQFLMCTVYYKEIAEKLFISTETVRRHVHNIYEKLHVSSRTDAINKVFRNNTLPGFFMTL